jgi:hypothetical protein
LGSSMSMNSSPGLTWKVILPAVVIARSLLLTQVT